MYSRDTRFDGRFFVGAITTGLFCRNVCPVPFADSKNIVLFAGVTAAEAAGFRPCKRCRPRAIPGTPAWLGTLSVVFRGLQLILEGALNEGSVEDLAGRLGLGSRQLRRLFVYHLGAAPIKIAMNQRVHLARKLVTESRLPMTDIAFSAGFKSIREFNHAVLSATGQSPSYLRRAKGTSQGLTQGSGLQLSFPYKNPFDWKSLIAFLKMRAIPGVEVVTQQSYQRTIEIAGVPGFLTVRPVAMECRLAVHLEISNYEGLAQTAERIRNIFDLRSDPIQIAKHLSKDPQLLRLLKIRPGLRLPGIWDGFEAAVLAVLGQSLSESGQRKIIARLVRMFGRPIDTPIPGLNYLFPQPEILSLADLAKAGVSKNCSRTLHRLARSSIRRQLAFERSRTLEQAVSRLSAVRGIDESTANYIVMRAFGEPDAFPSRDKKLRANLSQSELPVTPPKAVALAEQWRPWRAYAAMYMTTAYSKFIRGRNN